MSYEYTTEEVDLNVHPTAKKLVDVCKEFFAEINNLYVGAILIVLTLQS